MNQDNKVLHGYLLFHRDAMNMIKDSHRYQDPTIIVQTAWSLLSPQVRQTYINRKKPVYRSLNLKGIKNK
jgi:hypothetical protein